MLIKLGSRIFGTSLALLQANWSIKITFLLLPCIPRLIVVNYSLKLGLYLSGPSRFLFRGLSPRILLPGTTQNKKIARRKSLKKRKKSLSNSRSWIRWTAREEANRLFLFSLPQIWLHELEQVYQQALKKKRTFPGVEIELLRIKLLWLTSSSKANLI